jgi:16S rRNA (cytidine1402-2'-O)-methyltransferase
MGTLYVVATPIGNLEDVTARALRVLGEVSLIAAEDTRHTGRLLARFGIRTPMLSYHAFNERARRERLLAALAEGDVALVSDAGTPGIADPGADLVAAATAAGYAVSPVPGPSALVAAVAASGLVDGPFVALGFLPRRGEERRAVLARAAGTGFALVLFEAPTRLATTLSDLVAVLGERPAAVARELTKLHEEIRRGPLAELVAHYDGRDVRGEVVIVVGPAPTTPDEAPADAEEVVAGLLRAGLAPSAAAREAAKITGLPRSVLYDLARPRPPGDEPNLDDRPRGPQR